MCSLHVLHDTRCFGGRKRGELAHSEVPQCAQNKLATDKFERDHGPRNRPISSTPPLLGICGVFASGKMNRVRQDDAPGSPAAGNARSDSVTGREAGAKEHHGHDAKHLRTTFFVPCRTTQRPSAAVQIEGGPVRGPPFRRTAGYVGARNSPRSQPCVLRDFIGSARSATI
jgi:hypothetical protein